MGKTTNYWFKRRRYGWGWVPVTWQGWLTVIVYLVVVIAGGATLEAVPEGEMGREVGIFIIVVAVATGALFRITLARGPKPRWRWGKNPDDNPDEDW